MGDLVTLGELSAVVMSTFTFALLAAWLLLKGLLGTLGR
jgi:hypothetical protein